MSSDDEDYVRSRLPGAPEEAIQQIALYHAFHRIMVSDPERMRDLGNVLVMLEEYLAIVKRWNPIKLEAEIKHIVKNFGDHICKGDPTCIAEFEATIRKLVDNAEGNT
jgi:hypothetical protein